MESLAEREEISRGLASYRSLRAIALQLGLAPSTISREVNRTWNRAHRPKTCKLVANRALARVVASKLQLEWAPEQIAGWLKHTYPDDENYQVSHETIYKSLFIIVEHRE